MAKKSLLLVDADPRSLRVLEVSLRKAGYSVATCRDTASALEMVELSPPDLILSDTRLPGDNGFELVEALRREEQHRNIPFMFLSSDASVESKVRGLELGVEDYLTKPIYIREIIARINLTLQRQEREGLARRTSISKTRFTGTLGEMGLVDLIQTIDISRKSGVLELTQGAERGSISFRDGQLVDAELGSLRAEAAIYRLLLWNEGDFEIDFRPVRAEARIVSSTQAILMEGMRRIDEWGRLLEQIPSLDNVFEVSDAELIERLAEIPDEINEILRHMDGRRSLIQVVDACAGDDLEVLTAITKLFFEGLIFPSGRTAAEEEGPELDEQLVPGELEPAEAEPSVHGPTPEALVPRTSTIVPPSGSDPVEVERAKTDAPSPEVSGDVPERAQIEAEETPEAANAEADADGTVDASDSERELEEPPSQPDSPPDDPRDDEERMAKKGRRRRRKRDKAVEASVTTAQSNEAQSNVIQFPAQAKRDGAVAQRAVNDDLVNEREDADDRAESRADETERRARVSDAPKSERAPKADARDGADEDERGGESAARGGGDPEAAEAKSGDPEAAEAKSGDPEAAEAKSGDPEAADAKAADSEAAEPKAPEAAESAESREVDTPSDEAVDSTAEAEAIVEGAAEPQLDEEAAGQAEPQQAEPKSDREAAAPTAEKEEPKSEDRQPADAEPSEERVAAKDASKAKVASARESQAPKKGKGKKGKKGRSSTPSPAARESAPSSPPADDSEKIIRSVTQTGDHAAIAADFFRSTDALQKVDHETWDDLQPVALSLSPGMKRAKHLTFGILAGGLILIAGFLIYQNVVMPAPVELTGAALPRELPSASMAPGASDDDDPGATSDTPDEPEGADSEESLAAAVPEAEEAEAADDTDATEDAEAELAAAEEVEPAEVEAGAAEAEAAEAEAVEAAPAPGGYEELLAEANSLRRRRPADAIEAYERAIAVNPNGAEAMAELSFLLLNRGRNQDAAQYAERATTADRTSALGWLVLGAARQELRDAAGAREAYQACVEHGEDARRVRECRMMLR